jgi:hypothetical protein
MALEIKRDGIAYATVEIQLFHIPTTFCAVNLNHAVVSEKQPFRHRAEYMGGIRAGYSVFGSTCGRAVLIQVRIITTGTAVEELPFAQSGKAVLSLSETGRFKTVMPKT